MRTRTDKEMYDLIINFAHKDHRVRQVLLNGSRVNPNIKKDIFQDFDIVYLVTDVKPFKDERYILAHFGEIMLMQKPEDITYPPPIGDGRYTYLMQFTDGNRIDMTIDSISKIREYTKDSLTKVLLDKDNRIPELPTPNEDSYLIAKPTRKLYDDCCNQFIWGLGSHIPKTIWRKELPLLKIPIERVLREPLLQMIKWHVGINSDYKCTIGKGGKYLQEHLEPELWHDFKRTYSDYRFDNIWTSLFLFNDLFTRIAKHVGQTYDFPFPQEKSERALEFLEHVKELPEEAEAIF